VSSRAVSSISLAGMADIVRLTISALASSL
jgi:hypothetical protein